MYEICFVLFCFFPHLLTGAKAEVAPWFQCFWVVFFFSFSFFFLKILDTFVGGVGDGGWRWCHFYLEPVNG